MPNADSRSTIKLRDPVALKLREFAHHQGVTRSRAVELLLEDHKPIPVDMSRDHALELLAQSAENGSVPARIAFERALRSATNSEAPTEPDPLDELRQRRTTREGHVA